MDTPGSARLSGSVTCPEMVPVGLPWANAPVATTVNASAHNKFRVPNLTSSLSRPPAQLITLYAFSAASTRAVVNGTRRIRTPVASKTALAMAANIGLHTVSPAP